MKTVLLLAGCLTIPWIAFGQEAGPVHWALFVSTTNSLPLRQGAKLTAHLHASIEPGWHMYSLHEEPGGPIAMTIHAPLRQPLAINGDIDAPRPNSAADPGFGIVTYFYTGSVDLAVPLRATRKFSGQVMVDVRYQACNRETCLPPAVEHLTAALTKSSEE